jgi:hypothetical protein
MGLLRWEQNSCADEEVRRLDFAVDNTERVKVRLAGSTYAQRE